MSECAHEGIETLVAISRILHDETGETTGYVAECQVRCPKCGPFGWRGVPPGGSFKSPHRSADALTLRAPLLAPADLADEPLGEPRYES